MDKMINSLSLRISDSQIDSTDLLQRIETLSEKEFDSKKYINDGKVLYHTMTTTLGEKEMAFQGDFSVYCAFYNDLVFVIHSLDQEIVKFKKVILDNFSKDDIFGVIVS